MSQRNSLQAVLWDLDGTIIDSEPLWLEAEIEMLHSYGLEFGDEARDELIGKGLWDGAKVFQDMGVPLSADQIVDRLTTRVIELYDERKPVWRPGAIELLAQVKKAGIPNVMVTMSTHPIAKKVAEMLPENTFVELVTGDRVPNAKPHPEPYLYGAKAAGVPIENCVAFEDSVPGLRSAASSGAVSVGIEHLVPLAKGDSHVLVSTLVNVELQQLNEWMEKLYSTTPKSGGHLDLRGSLS